MLWNIFRLGLKMTDCRDDTLKRIAGLSRSHDDVLMQFCKAVESEGLHLSNDEIKVLFSSVYSDILVMLGLCATLVNHIENKPIKDERK